jgi:Na+-translocating ferredoxin:NAD+ oxidoreductase RnfG subunit
MAMTFTLVAHVREQLSTILQDRVKKKNQEEAERERKALEVGVIPSAYFQGLTDSIP